MCHGGVCRKVRRKGQATHNPPSDLNLTFSNLLYSCVIVVYSVGMRGVIHTDAHLLFLHYTLSLVAVWPWGFLITKMTESPRKNILGMKRSLGSGSAFFWPLPVLGTSVQYSLTFSNTILQCLSKALTRPSNFLSFLTWINTWVWLRTLWVNKDKGPCSNDSSSSFSCGDVNTTFDRQNTYQLELCLGQGILLGGAI